MTAREFIQNTGKAEKLADRGPVFITKHGKTSYVLMNIGDYNKLAKTKPKQSIRDMLYDEAAAEIEFEIPELRLDLGIREVDLD